MYCRSAVQRNAPEIYHWTFNLGNQLFFLCVWDPLWDSSLSLKIAKINMTQQFSRFWVRMPSYGTYCWVIFLRKFTNMFALWYHKCLCVLQLQLSACNLNPAAQASGCSRYGSTTNLSLAQSHYGILFKRYVRHKLHFLTYPTTMLFFKCQVHLL